MIEPAPMDDMARLREAVAALPRLERKVYLLSATEGLDHQAIAGRLGLSVDAVEAHLADALFHLDRALRRPGPTSLAAQE